MGTVTFQPCDGYHQVTLQVADRLVVVPAGGLDTDDPLVTAALDEHPLVQRASKPGRPKQTSEGD